MSTLQWSSVVNCTLAGLWHDDIQPQLSESALWKLLSIHESSGKLISEDPDASLPKWQSKANVSHIQTILVKLSVSWLPGPGKVLPCQCSSSCLSVMLLKMVYLRVCKPSADFFPPQIRNHREGGHLYFLCPTLQFIPWGFSLPYLSESCLSLHLTACVSDSTTRVTNKVVCWKDILTGEDTATNKN